MWRFERGHVDSTVCVEENSHMHKVRSAKKNKKNVLFIFCNPFFEALPNAPNVFCRYLKLETLMDELHEVNEVVIVARFMKSSAQEWRRNIHGP